MVCREWTFECIMRLIVTDNKTKCIRVCSMLNEYWISFKNSKVRETIIINNNQAKNLKSISNSKFKVKTKLTWCSKQ